LMRPLLTPLSATSVSPCFIDHVIGERHTNISIT
jgi:hypothetical protein